MPLKTQHDEAPTLNLTSMIDVLFLLIIFFMVATKFDELERNIDVAVPEVSEAGNDNPPPQPVVIMIQSDGRIELDGTTLTPEELTADLVAKRGSSGDLPVVICGDSQCAFQHIASALAACRQAGVSELGITVRIAGMGNVSR